MPDTTAPPDAATTAELLLWPAATVVYLADAAGDVGLLTIDATLDASRTGGPIIIAATLDELLARWDTAHAVVVDWPAAKALAGCRVDARKGVTVLVYAGAINTVTRAHWDTRDAADITHGIRLDGKWADAGRDELVAFLADQPDAEQVAL